MVILVIKLTSFYCCSQEEAQKKYVELVDELVGKYVHSCNLQL